ncbi:MAG: hypothetical protein P8Z50_06040 [candidate division WOR-3 bacterium]|jgi:hypothetical protein
MKKTVISMLFILLIFITLISCTKGKSKTVKETKKIFELASIERVNSIVSNSADGTAFYWKKTDKANGVLILLKYKGDSSITLYSSDFSLGFEHEFDIPRRRCIGISFGNTSMDNPSQKFTWMLGGAISRTWASGEKPYFGIIFEAPKSVTEFSLYYTKPLIEGIKIK